ncbi:L,D-transpeptidase family protein [Photobacterium sp. BZF1]|uniref:L,D-transpeptidase family protein n=1 Tax=Photobacterium sp. BZF1 TaxID=1904457 RepID=UPI001653B2E8|nr:L,D-transpeptidase family protein [Photobacterium sp. BZF1]MBC7001632.1 L,D-transpeptidase family protein [Photobacterium sp. BZF1]
MTGSVRTQDRIYALLAVTSAVFCTPTSAQELGEKEYAALASPGNFVADNQSQPNVLPEGATAVKTGLDLSLLSVIDLSSTQSLCGFAESNLCFTTEVERIYASNGYMPLWRDEKLREALDIRLRTLAFSGLTPGIEARISELDQLSSKPDLRAYDMLATDTFLLYEALKSVLYSAPSTMFRNQTVSLMTESGSQSLPYSVAGAAIIPSFLAHRLIGSNESFTLSKRVLSEVERFDQMPAHRYQPHGRQLIKPEVEIPNGLAMIEVLNTYGDLGDEAFYRLTSKPVLTNSGELNQAIRRFQQRNGLEPDGIIGSATARQMALPYKEVARLLALNSYRSQMGASGEERPSIRVNIPDYRLQITYKQEVVFESKVIVGRTTRPTNLFSSSMNIMVVNPRWNVPETIKKKDVIPGMKASPDYLQRKNLTMIRSWRDRTEISPDMVEWSTVNPHTFPYEFMQKPGRGNALGNVKFLMPNDYSVYLHDTPSRKLFNKAKRNLSSGCVRVEKAAELADFVLDYQQRPSWRNYQQLVTDRRTDTITLPRKIDVDVTYVTAWIDENDQLQLREDIYGYDRPIRRPVKLKYSTVKNYRQ